ncbi:hypothetical protein NLJ89_g9030 [Agrocybe chaxingu]|uniref:Cytochrome P450 n=1 Tax=Agrocybe chaxingu TaxID=84603 RepID=A0A9W8JWI1_9AGAR|nr:hypothetical protein NLJ89_g9030 [Agrocybe chaxingu]
MAETISLFSTGCGFIVTGWGIVIINIAGIVGLVALSYYRGETRRLRHIPTVGPTAPILSYLGAFQFIFDASNVIRNRIERVPNSTFKVADVFRWQVVIHDPTLIEEVKMLPDSILSSFDALNEASPGSLSSMLSANESVHEFQGLQTWYSLGPNIVKNPYHLPIVRTQLTRALPQLVPAVHEEVVDAFNDFIPATNGKDPDYIGLVVQYATDVIRVGTTLRLVPRVLRPLLNTMISHVPRGVERGMKHLAPVFTARRESRQEKGDVGSEKSLDLLSWLMEAAQGEEKTDWHLTSRLLMMNWTAIHTSTMTFTHALYYLATYPEYVKPLREEVEAAVKRCGWSKVALDEMHLVDSFIKESQRVDPLAVLLVSRILVKDHVFSDGMLLPKGTLLSVATPKTHLNPETYEDPLRFDGFRYAKLRERSLNQTSSQEASGGPEKKFDMVSANIDSLGFGLGRHACPGRFFAACELKIMLAHILVTYDVKLGNEGNRPANKWYATACFPNPTAHVLFRKRTD